jgi:hypothetical protein
MNIRTLAACTAAVGSFLVPAVAFAQSAATLSVPIHLTTSSIEGAINGAVPQKEERLGAWEFHDNTGIKYGAWRGPITVSTVGSAVRARTRIQYALAACQRVKKPFPLKGHFCQQFAQCGMGEPLAEVDVAVDVSGSWAPDWSFKPNVATSASVVRPCQLTVANIDVSGRAINLLRDHLQREAAKVSNQLHFRAAAEQAWSKVAVKQVAPDLWLTWQPVSATITPLQFLPGEVTTTATLAATPMLVQGQAAPSPAPLPGQLTVAPPTIAVTPSWKLAADLAWNDVTKALVSAFGSYQPSPGVTATPRRVYGANDGRVHADFDLAGAGAAAVSVSGDLVYAAQTDTAKLDNLRVDGSPSLLTTFVVSAFLAHVEANMRWQLRPLLQPVLDKVNAAGLTTQPLGPGASIQGPKVAPSGLGLEIDIPGQMDLKL